MKNKRTLCAPDCKRSQIRMNLAAIHLLKAQGTRSEEESVPRHGRRGPSGQGWRKATFRSDRVPCAGTELKASLGGVAWLTEIHRGDHPAVLRGQAAPEPSGCFPEKWALGLTWGCRLADRDTPGRPSRGPARTSRSGAIGMFPRKMNFGCSLWAVIARLF